MAFRNSPTGIIAFSVGVQAPEEVQDGDFLVLVCVALGEAGATKSLNICNDPSLNPRPTSDSLPAQTEAWAEPHAMLPCVACPTHTEQAVLAGAHPKGGRIVS